MNEKVPSNGTNHLVPSDGPISLAPSTWCQADDIKYLSTWGQVKLRKPCFYLCMYYDVHYTTRALNTLSNLRYCSPEIAICGICFWKTWKVRYSMCCDIDCVVLRKLRAHILLVLRGSGPKRGHGQPNDGSLQEVPGMPQMCICHAHALDLHI